MYVTIRHTAVTPLIEEIVQVPPEAHSIRTKLPNVWNPNEGAGIENCTDWIWRYSRSLYVMFALPDLSE